MQKPSRCKSLRARDCPGQAATETRGEWQGLSFSTSVCAFLSLHHAEEHRQSYLQGCQCPLATNHQQVQAEEVYTDTQTAAEHPEHCSRGPVFSRSILRNGAEAASLILSHRKLEAAGAGDQIWILLRGPKHHSKLL